MNRDFKTSTRPFLGMSSKCEECGSLFDRRSKVDYVCPTCKERLAEIQLPPDTKPILSAKDRMDIFSRAMKYGHKDYQPFARTAYRGRRSPNTGRGRTKRHKGLS